MRNQLRRLAVAVAAATALTGSLAVPASADEPVPPPTYQYNTVQNTLQPVIRQTNLWYTTAAFKVPTKVTSTGVISRTYHSWQLWDGPQGRGTLRAEACTVDLTRCTSIVFTPSQIDDGGYPAYVASGSTTAFAGLPATTQFVYRYRLDATKTQVLAKPIESSMHSISVDWSEPF